MANFRDHRLDLEGWTASNASASRPVRTSLGPRANASAPPRRDDSVLGHCRSDIEFAWRCSPLVHVECASHAMLHEAGSLAARFRACATFIRFSQFSLRDRIYFRSGEGGHVVEFFGVVGEWRRTPSPAEQPKRKSGTGWPFSRVACFHSAIPTRDTPPSSRPMCAPRSRDSIHRRARASFRVMPSAVSCPARACICTRRC